MMSAFRAPSFRWPFWSGLFPSLLPFIVASGAFVLTEPTRSASAAVMSLKLVFGAFAFTGLVQLIALPIAIQQWITRRDSRTWLNGLSVVATILSLILVAMVLVVWRLTINAP